MGKKLILSAAFTLLLVGLSVGYMAMEPGRQASAARRIQEEAVGKGTRLYASLCMDCHGPVGEGAVGPALNRPVFREGGPDEMKGTGEVIRDTIRAGRPGTAVPSFLRGTDGSWISRTAMPAWSQQNGGPLTSQDIEDLVTFLQYGDWGKVMGSAPAPNLKGKVPENWTMSAAEQEKALGLLQTKGCLSCHTVGNRGGVIGPDLTHVGSRRDAEYIANWIKDPGRVDRSNYVWSSGQNIQMGKSIMPAVPLNDSELKTITDYLLTLE